MNDVSRENRVAESGLLEEIQRQIDDSPMDRSQWATVAIAFGISVVDGYDVLSATFVLPSLQRLWALDPANLGSILASGLMGMAAGSFLIAPTADIFGRRPLVLFALAIATAGLLLSANSQSFQDLLAFRGATGLGIGTIMAVMSSVAAESTNRRWRALAISLIVIGFPVGGMLAGLTATFFLEHFGWRSEFFVGATITALMIPAVFFFLPEPLQSLLNKRRSNRSTQIEAKLLVHGYAYIDQSMLPIQRKRSYAAIFAPGQRMVTIWITICQLILMQSVLFVLNWLPQIVASAGGDTVTASLAGTAASAAGIVGGLTFGAITNTQNLQRMTVISALALGIMIAAIGFSPISSALFILIASLNGIFAYASQAGFYTMLPGCFEQQARATGIGFVLGVARLGSATSPLIAGWLFSGGLGRAVVCSIFGMLAIGASCLFSLRLKPSGGSR